MKTPIAALLTIPSLLLIPSAARPGEAPAPTAEAIAPDDAAAAAEPPAGLAAEAPAQPSQYVEQSTPPAEAPPAPPSATPPAPPPQAQAQAPAYPSAPDGQWIRTQQYGWVFVPYADAFTYVPPGGYGEPYEYLYYPAYGWIWVAAPWVWGFGPWPYFGVFGPVHFAWYGHGWWRYPGRWHYAPSHSFPYSGVRPAPVRGGVPYRGVRPAPIRNGGPAYRGAPGRGYTYQGGFVRGGGLAGRSGFAHGGGHGGGHAGWGGRHR